MAQLTSSQSQGVMLMQISVRTPELPTVFRVIIAGSVDPPTQVASWDGVPLAMDAGNQWKMVAPGVWDLTLSCFWPAKFPSAARPGPATKTVKVTHAGVNGGKLDASGLLDVWSESGATDTAPLPVSDQALLPTMAGGRFQAMFVGAVAGGAKIRVTTSKMGKEGGRGGGGERGKGREGGGQGGRERGGGGRREDGGREGGGKRGGGGRGGATFFRDTKITLEVHLVFIKGVTTSTGVSLVGQVGADTSDPLPLACPLTTKLMDPLSLLIPGVFTCSKVNDINIPVETATKPKVLGLHKFMAALVGATMEGNYLASTFSLIVNGQSEKLYYSL
ncbi:unnamed protein product [Closterium sp. Naga37s-1]|nr:unnamed protein product [Closterium sp. Naga37s-1]